MMALLKNVTDVGSGRNDEDDEDDDDVLLLCRQDMQSRMY